MGRLLGIDYGEKRIGLALSDELHSIAFEHEIWQASDFFKNISSLISEKEVEKIILGYPLNVSGGHTRETEEVLQFKKKLEAHIPGIPVELLDERFSSHMAEQLAMQSGGTKKNIDALAAQIFLQNYLNKNQTN